MPMTHDFQVYLLVCSMLWEGLCSRLVSGGLCYDARGHLAHLEHRELVSLATSIYSLSFYLILRRRIFS